MSRVETAHRAGGLAGCLVLLQLMSGSAAAEVTPARGATDARVRTAIYSSEQVYRLQGYVGYEIDLQFEPDEVFVGLGSGDIEGLSFVAQDNHLFIKPRAANVWTNLTVLTSRRHYQFDYRSAAHRPGASDEEVIYALRFSYPPATASAGSTEVTGELHSDVASLNVDYWYCGSAALKPLAASDDGIHTRLRFGARAEQPAIFVQNEDGSESLLNFSMQDGDVILHRVVQQLIVRRGRLSGRIVNQHFEGSGARLNSGTVSPRVERLPVGVGQ